MPAGGGDGRSRQGQAGRSAAASGPPPRPGAPARAGSSGSGFGAPGGQEYDCPICETVYDVEDPVRVGDPIYCWGCDMELKVTAIVNRRVRVAADD